WPASGRSVPAGATPMPLRPNTTRTGFVTVAASAGSMMYAIAPAGAGLRTNAAGAGDGAAAGAAAAGAVAAGAAGGDCGLQATSAAQARMRVLRVSMGDDS